MSQYRDGTVSVNIGSSTVTGVSTAFTNYAQAGDWFHIESESVMYAVASVTDDTHLELASNYAGDENLSGASYIITTDFTPNYSLPLVKIGDREWPVVLEKALTLIDSNLGAGSDTPDFDSGWLDFEGSGYDGGADGGFSIAHGLDAAPSRWTVYIRSHVSPTEVNMIAVPGANENRGAMIYKVDGTSMYFAWDLQAFTAVTATGDPPTAVTIAYSSVYIDVRIFAWE
jgi:hypothetical protein